MRLIVGRRDHDRAPGPSHRVALMGHVHREVAPKSNLGESITAPAFKV